MANAWRIAAAGQRADIRWAGVGCNDMRLSHPTANRHEASSRGI